MLWQADVVHKIATLKMMIQMIGMKKMIEACQPTLLYSAKHEFAPAIARFLWGGIHRMASVAPLTMAHTTYLWHV